MVGGIWEWVKWVRDWEMELLWRAGPSPGRRMPSTGRGSEKAHGAGVVFVSKSDSHFTVIK